jgi:hypothetical protein
MKASTHLDIRPNHHHPKHGKYGQENDCPKIPREMKRSVCVPLKEKRKGMGKRRWWTAEGLATGTHCPRCGSQTRCARV